MFSFLVPWFLVGLGALSVPLIVHLIHKDRKDVMLFPSLMFLETVPIQSVRRQRIRDFWLFLLRCLMVILLVLAFARPFFASKHAAAATATGGRDIVIALDRSYSMGYGDRWQRAVAAAKDVVAKMRPTDRATVVYFTETTSAATELTKDRTALLAALDSVRPTAGGTRYDVVLRFVPRIFGDSAQPRREVVLVSDYQQAGWGDHTLPTLPVGTTLTKVNVGSDTTDNAALTQVSIRYDTAAGRSLVIAEARLVNHAQTPVRQRQITFELDGRPAQTRLVDCPANGTVTVTFEPTVIASGRSRGHVYSGADALEADNHFYFVVTRAPSLPLLVVVPDDAISKSSAFLTSALRINDRLAFPFRVVPSGRLTGADLRGVALVIVDGAQIPGGDVGQRIANYVKDGGGLLVALGNQSRPSAWPALANDLLPRPSQTIDRDKDNGATLGFFDRDHPIFELFTPPHSGDVSAPRYRRYWAMTPAAGDRQLARFDDGRAALLERRVGAGRVLVWASDLDGLWNDLPLHAIYLPFVHEAVKYTAGYSEQRRWTTVGQMLSLPSLFGESLRRTDSATASKAVGNAQYVAIAPGGIQRRFETSTASAPASLELTETGFYRINRTGSVGDSTTLVAVNADRQESDLVPLDTALFTATTAPLKNPRGTAEDVQVPTAADVEHRQGLWWYILAAALLLLGTETFLSNRLRNSATATRFTRTTS